MRTGPVIVIRAGADALGATKKDFVLLRILEPMV